MLAVDLIEDRPLHLLTQALLDAVVVLGELAEFLGHIDLEVEAVSDDVVVVEESHEVCLGVSVAVPVEQLFFGSVMLRANQEDAVVEDPVGLVPEFLFLLL